MELYKSKNKMKLMLYYTRNFSIFILQMRIVITFWQHSPKQLCMKQIFLGRKNFCTNTYFEKLMFVYLKKLFVGNFENNKMSYVICFLHLFFCFYCSFIFSYIILLSWSQPSCFYVSEMLNNCWNINTY